MTLQEISKVLKTSFKNGFYIRRPNFDGVELYFNKNGEAWHIELNVNYTFKADIMPAEREADDWEIVS